MLVRHKARRRPLRSTLHHHLELCNTVQLLATRRSGCSDTTYMIVLSTSYTRQRPQSIHFSCFPVPQFRTNPLRGGVESAKSNVSRCQTERSCSSRCVVCKGSQHSRAQRKLKGCIPAGQIHNRTRFEGLPLAPLKSAFEVSIAPS